MTVTDTAPATPEAAPLTLGDPAGDPFSTPADQPEILLGRGFASTADLIGCCVAVMPTVLEEVENGFFKATEPETEKGGKNAKMTDRVTANVIVFGRTEIMKDGNRLTAYDPNPLGVIEISDMFIGQTTLVDQLRSYVGKGMFLGVLAKSGRAYQFNDPSKAQRLTAIEWWRRVQDAPPV